MLDNLPNDILRLIATHLSLLDVVTLFRTNKVINKALDNEIMGHQYFEIYNWHTNGIQWKGSYNAIIKDVSGINWPHRVSAIRKGKWINTSLCLGPMVVKGSLALYYTDTLLTLSKRIKKSAPSIEGLERFQTMLLVEDIYISFNLVDQVTGFIGQSLPIPESLGLNITNAEDIPIAPSEKIVKHYCDIELSKWSSFFENSNLFSTIKYIYIFFSIKAC
jgi:hypothetical protein